MTLARMIRVHALPDRPTLTLREIEEKDIDQVTDLLDRYMKRFDLVPEFSKEEVKHQFLSGSGHGPVRGDHRREGQVIWTYVVEASFNSVKENSVNNLCRVRKAKSLILSPFIPYLRQS